MASLKNGNGLTNGVENPNGYGRTSFTGVKWRMVREEKLERVRKLSLSQRLWRILGW